MTPSPSSDIAVIGGGLAGLAASIFAARAGRSVILLERAPALGGRASTQDREGYLFNQGPHALYRAGHGAAILRELGVTWDGALPKPEGSWGLFQGKQYLLPRTPAALQASGFLPHEAALEAAGLFARLGPDYDLEQWQGRSWAEWLATEVRHPETRALFSGLMRLSTYCNDDSRLSAGAALTQFITGAGGVDYIDGGWQSLVNSLKTEAEQLGVRIETRSRITEIRCGAHGAEVCLEGGRKISSAAVIGTLPPSALAPLINEGKEDVLRQWASQSIPIYAACLDIGLRRLLNSENQFAIGLDQPLYYSVHTRSARLAPEGGALIQLAKYLPTDSTEAGVEIERELEALLDDLQPGWRGEVVAERFLPKMIVANAVVTAAQGGTAGRPGPVVPGLPSLFVAGDWVGPEGMLADASLASAKAAAELALESLPSSQDPNLALTR